MQFHFNKQSEKQKRRDLRDYPTYNEKLLWLYLRKKQICGERFLREYSVDKYVLDFYCPRLHLAVEIDGPTHFESIESIMYDKIRQEYIESLGIKFIRFTDDEVNLDSDGVLRRVEEEVKKLQTNMHKKPLLPPL